MCRGAALRSNGKGSSRTIPPENIVKCKMQGQLQLPHKATRPTRIHVIIPIRLSPEEIANCKLQIANLPGLSGLPHTYNHHRELKHPLSQYLLTRIQSHFSYCRSVCILQLPLLYIRSGLSISSLCCLVSSYNSKKPGAPTAASEDDSCKRPWLSSAATTMAASKV